MAPRSPFAYNVTVEVDPLFAAQVDADDLARVARATLDMEGVPTPAALALLVTDDAAVRDLNRRYRGLDEPTDVLSFGEESAEPLDNADTEWVDATGADTRYLGDIVIAFPYTQRQAAEAARPLADELAHLVAHGVLHLLGHDHAEPEEERVMRGKERAVLGERFRLPPRSGHA